MKKKIGLHKAQKRHFLLLEILIALILIVFCAFPLISPHITLMKAQQEFKAVLDLDRYVSIIYVDTLEKLHLMDATTWNKVKEKQVVEIDDSMLDRLKIPKNFPYNGRYQFKELIVKKNETSGWSVVHAQLYFTFTLKSEQEVKPNETLIFPYEFVFLKKSPLNETEKEKPDVD